MTKETKSELLFELRGVEICSGQVYKIKDKPDYSAPTGLVEIGATKIPHDGVGDEFPFPFQRFDEQGNGVYDTGFYAESRCYNSLDPKERTTRANRAKKVLEKYRNYTGNPHLFQHDTEEGKKTLDKALFKVETDDVLMSDNPKDLMTIYVGLLTGNLADAKNENDPQFNGASYSLVDATQNTKDSDEKATTAFGVMRQFNQMLSAPEDRKNLIRVLNYIGVTTAKDASDQALESICMNRLIQSPTDIESFERWVGNLTKETAVFTLEVYERLKEMEGRDSRLVKQPKKGYHFNSTYLGVDLKNIARDIAEKKEFEDILYAILDIEKP